ncbi:hypothetical protein GGH99_003170 [Coemansia sp. RSA 1285]|nr:hypothetical protein GGH99_003170 [Coemansia sp. RSA 1285]
MKLEKIITGLVSIWATTAGVLGDTTDYDNFMSSLSYNWQNEFSDLRYQVDQLQKTDPLKYQQLAAQLGLKPGTQIDVPSQFNDKWASKFVMAAGLYTPPAPTQAATFNPSEASPTGASSQLLITAVKTDGESATPLPSSGDESADLSAMSGDSAVTAASDHSSHDAKHSSHGDNSEDATSGLDDAIDSSTSVFQQNGNPVVGSINTDFNPIVPSGTGYSASSAVVPIQAYAVLATAITSLLLALQL